MKYLKTFEELSPELYKKVVAGGGILSRGIEADERITGKKASEEAEEQAKEKAKELEDFAKEREKYWDKEKKVYDFSKVIEDV